MANPPGAMGTLTRARVLLASAFVLLTVIGVWKFIDYRMKPPPPPAVVAPR